MRRHKPSPAIIVARSDHRPPPDPPAAAIDFGAMWREWRAAAPQRRRDRIMGRLARAELSYAIRATPRRKRRLAKAAMAAHPYQIEGRDSCR